MEEVYGAVEGDAEKWRPAVLQEDGSQHFL